MKYQNIKGIWLTHNPKTRSDFKWRVRVPGEDYRRGFRTKREAVQFVEEFRVGASASPQGLAC